jgi:hypothetical protein
MPQAFGLLSWIILRWKQRRIAAHGETRSAMLHERQSRQGGRGARASIMRDTFGAKR